MPWNFLQLEIAPEDHLIRPMYGPGDFTREQALGEIQSILDRAALQSTQFGKLADRWKRGGVADDTLFFWTVHLGGV